MPRMNIFEFLEMCYMSWEFWVGAIIGLWLGNGLHKLITFKELRRKDKEIKIKNDELADYRVEIRELKKEINELKNWQCF